MRFVITLFAFLLSYTLFAQCDESYNSSTKFRYKTLEFYCAVKYSSMSLDKSFSDLNGIGDRGHGFMFVFEPRLFGLLLVGFDMGGEYVPDNRSFTQETTAGTQVSTASLLRGSYYFGITSPLIRFNDRFALQPFLKYGDHGVSGTRSVKGCVDCKETFIAEPDHGNFFEPGLEAYIGWYYGIGINTSVRLYPAGSEISSTFTLGISSRLSYLFRY